MTTPIPARCLVLLLLPAVAGCAGSADGAGSSSTAGAAPMATAAQAAPAASSAASTGGGTDAAALLSAIRREIGTATCTADAQCRTLGVGWKACGGPESYLAWSAANASGDRLATLASGQQQARRRDVERSGMLSNCTLQQDPGAICAPAAGGERSCQLRRTTDRVTAP